MFSAGADILYGAHAGNGRELLWYRYLPATETWADTGRGAGKVVLRSGQLPLTFSSTTANA